MLRRIVNNRSAAMRVAATAMAMFVVLAPASPFPVAAAAAGGQSDGIKIHGDWTIEIREPDGTLVRRREFQNALMPDGRVALATLLEGSGSIAFWSVRIGGACTGNLGECALLPSTSTFTGPMIFKTLIVKRVGETLELSGTATAERTSVIPYVGTMLTGSFPSPNSLLTYKQLSPAEPVAAGQIIQVKVVISFS